MIWQLPPAMRLQAKFVNLLRPTFIIIMLIAWCALLLTTRHDTVFVAGAGAFALVAVARYLVCRRALKVCAEAMRKAGKLCPRCLYDLEQLGDSGLCPECEQPYTSDEVKRAWSAAFAWFRAKQFRT